MKRLDKLVHIEDNTSNSPLTTNTPAGRVSQPYFRAGAWRYMTDSGEQDLLGASGSGPQVVALADGTQFLQQDAADSPLTAEYDYLDITGGENPIAVTGDVVSLHIRKLVVRGSAQKGYLVGKNFTESGGKPFNDVDEAADTGLVSVDHFEYHGPQAYSGNASNQHGGLFNYTWYAHYGKVVIDGAGNANATENDGFYSKGHASHVQHLLVRNMAVGPQTNVLCNIKGDDRYIQSGSWQSYGLGQSAGTIILQGNGSKAGEVYEASQQTGFQAESSWYNCQKLVVTNCIRSLQLGSTGGGGSYFGRVFIQGPDSYHLRNDGLSGQPSDPYQSSSQAIICSTSQFGGLQIMGGLVEGVNEFFSLSVDGTNAYQSEIGGVELGPIIANGVGNGNGGRCIDMNVTQGTVKSFKCAVEFDDNWDSDSVIRMNNVHGIRITGRLPKVDDIFATSTNIQGFIYDQEYKVQTPNGSTVNLFRLPVGDNGQWLRIWGSFEVVEDATSAWTYKAGFWSVWKKDNTGAVVHHSSFIDTVNAYTEGTVGTVPDLVFDSPGSSRGRIRINPGASVVANWTVKWSSEFAFGNHWEA